MPVRSATYWEVVCDHDGCKRDLSDVTGEWTATPDKGSATDYWVDDDGVIFPDGRALCVEHRPSCESCHGWLTDPVESLRCDDCPADPEATETTRG